MTPVLGTSPVAATHSWAAGRPWVRLRLLGVALLFTGLFGLLGRATWDLQVTQADSLREKAEQQYLRDVELPSHRGRILDRNGNELAVSVEEDSVYANPRLLQAHPGAAANAAHALGRALHLDYREVARRLQAPRFFAWVKRHVTPDEARAVRELALPGVALAKEPRRYYPNSKFAGALLGWAGLDGRGLEGIELYYDKSLRGRAAELPALRDALGQDVLPTGAESASGTAGTDVVTTIDKFLQHRLERALEAGVVKNHAKAATAIALDPRTGEVLAMASVPTLNPNDPSATSGARNRVVTDPFEPGSTMKTFSITAAIEAGIVKPDDRWFCENGRYQIGSATIHDAEPIGNVSTTEVLAQSSNICTAKIAHRSGKERVEAMLRRFGFGAPTGIDLPGERQGLLRSSAKWGEIELATISFGQGITATPLQIATGYAAIANGGTWYRPHVLRRIVDDKGQTLSETHPEGRPVIAANVAATMRGLLHAVVQKGGTGEKLAIPGYPAGGKTGTAQKVDPATRRYSTDKWASSFVGFAPLEDPRVVLYVMVDEPTGSHYGSAVAGPIWREVMVDALSYLNVPPTEEIPPVAISAAARAKPVAHAEPAAAAGSDPNSAESNASDPNGVGSESARVDATAASDDSDEEGGVGAGGESCEIPRFVGLSMGEALDVARRARLPLEVVGTGRAVAQDPAPGKAREGVRCRVTFEALR